MVSVLGAGLLVGTALSVIIPEGVNTLYSSQISKYFKLLNQRLTLFHNSAFSLSYLCAGIKKKVMFKVNLSMTSPG